MPSQCRAAGADNYRPPVRSPRGTVVDGVRIDAVAGVVDFATGPVAKDWAALDKAIDALERDALLKRGVLGEFVEAGRWVGDPTTPMGRPATSLMRREPGVATGGKSLKDSTGTLFPQAQGRPGVDPRIAAFPRADRASNAGHALQELR